MAHTYVGPQEQVLPHLLSRTGGSGTLVLTPGEAYDFGDQPPPGPSWWWDPQPEAPEAGPVAEAAPDERWADARPWTREAEPDAETPPAPAVPAPRKPSFVDLAGGGEKAEG